MHFPKHGRGLAIGKVAEDDVEDLFDIGFRTRMYGGIQYPILNENTDFDSLWHSGSWQLKDTASANYGNCPISEGVGLITIEELDEMNVRQTVKSIVNNHIVIFERTSYIGQYNISYWNTEWTMLNADFVVESGQKEVDAGIWHYRKWYSGIAECWMGVRHTPTWSSTGIFYYENLPAIPIPFNDTLELLTLNTSIMFSNFTSFVMGRTEKTYTYIL